VTQACSTNADCTPGTCASWDPHGDPRADPNARIQKSDFLQTGGQFVDVCSGAPCVATHH